MRIFGMGGELLDVDHKTLDGSVEVGPGQLLWEGHGKLTGSSLVMLRINREFDSTN